MFPAFTDSRECKLLKVSKARSKIIVRLENAYRPSLCAASPCRRSGHLLEPFRGHQTHFALGLYQTCGSSCSRKTIILPNVKRPNNPTGYFCVRGGWFEWVAKVPLLDMRVPGSAGAEVLSLLGTRGRRTSPAGTRSNRVFSHIFLILNGLLLETAGSPRGAELRGIHRGSK